MSAPTSAAGSAAAAAAVSAGSKRSLADAAADSERQVQPRHCHDGPNAGAAAASSGGNGAAAASSSGGDAAANIAEPPAAPATRLYRHALESIFAFLNQHELVAALRVSREWLAAAKSMASLQLVVSQPSAPLSVIAESAVGRHITVLDLHNHPVPRPLTADSLAAVARHMPQLRGLKCDLQLAPTEEPLAFPPGLQQLTLQVDGRPAAADVNVMLLAVSCLPLLESFTIDLPSIRQLSFSPLAAIPQLAELTIHGPSGFPDLNDAQVAQLRALPRLRRLDVYPTPTSLLRRLLAQPHELQWQEIGLPHPLGDEAAALLPQLPSLTHVVAMCSGSLFEWLQRLPNLAHVHIKPFNLQVNVDSLTAALQRCPKIDYLGLARYSGLRSAHLADLLPRLPQLHSLTLYGLNIDSLSFLAQQPMVHQLSSLTLSGCTELPADELRHVHSLKGLRSLDISRSFTAPLDAHSRRLLTPPSAALPQLQKFFYTAPRSFI